MADQFFPKDFDNAPVMPVEATLYTIQATILNPETRVAMPAPDHVWLLVDVSLPVPVAIARSTPSDASGTCSLGAPTPLPGRFSLLFFPAPDPKKTSVGDAEVIRSIYRQKREAWIDLDQPDRWALEPTPGQLEMRRLFRVPAWSTSRKASLGGFKVVPPLSTAARNRFTSQGIILGADLAKFGPWDMPLDFNWAMAKVEFSFVDWQQNKFATLPPGLVVEALRTKGGKTTRVAAGITAAVPSAPPTPGTPPDRSAYLLLEGEKTLWKECHIQFRAPGNCFVDLSSKTTPTPDNRIKQGQSTQKLDEFNPLPVDWHSLGMQGTFTTSPRPSGDSPPAPPGAASPRSPNKLWDGIRFDLAKAANGDNATISFNVDDIVLCDAAAAPIQKKNRTAPITLLDHLLTVINPDPNIPYQSLTKRVGLVIPAPDGLQIPAATGGPLPPPRVGSARLIHCEGGLHDVRNDRVTVASGALGQIPCMGARAAVLNKHPNQVITDPLVVSTFSAVINLQLHQIDVPEVEDPATKFPLQHLLFYLPVRLGVDQMPNRAAILTEARKLLNVAGELWSPGHPGVANALTKRRYALIPRDPSKRNLSIIRFRTFFAERQLNPTLTISHARDSSGIARASTASGDGKLPTRIRSFDATVQHDISPRPAAGDAGDGVTSPSMVMAHELGHGAFSLNDEYVEFLDTSKAIGLDHSTPVLPGFDQLDEGTTDWRPYYSDAASMMNGNHVPRLRHFWQVTQLFQAQFTLPQPPYDLVHEAFTTTAGTDPVTAAPDPGTSLTYSVAPNNTRSPWPPAVGPSGNAIVNRPIPNGFGQVALFPIGDDESTVQRMFKVLNQPIVGLAKQNRMQALLIVRSRICFLLDPTMTPQEKLDILHLDFHKKIYEDAYQLLIRFVLNPKPAPVTNIRPPAPGGLHRIAVLFQPHYSVRNSDISKADIVFDISKTANPPRPNPFAGTITGKRINVMAGDFNFEEAWRLVLGVRNAPPGVIRSSDLEPITRLIETELGEPPNFRQPDIFA